MRLLCPFCQKAITVPDSDAGQAVFCPECSQQFAAPQLYTPAPSVQPPSIEQTPIPVPPAVPETYVPEPRQYSPAKIKPSEVPPLERPAPGQEKMVAVTLDPKVIRFVPAAALFVLFVLTFFSWNGLFPAGYSAYTQNAWYGMVGSMSRDEVAEDEMKIGEELKKNLHSSWWLLPYLVFLLPALALSFGGVLVELLKIKIPENLQGIWQYRPALLGVLTLMMVLFLSAQWASGFGLQRAVAEKLDEQNAEKKELAKTPEKMQRYEMNVDGTKGWYSARTTTWLRLALLANLIALLGAASETCLMLRGKKPPPRIGIVW